ncbi:hypothetical protein D4R71_00550 [bacterium]|nr:MAG: hypothetical protein D4R71_00550 [bacterium]
MRDNGPIVVKNNATPRVESEEVSAVRDDVTYSAGWTLVDLSSFALEYKVAATGIPSVKLELQQRSGPGVDWSDPKTLADIDSNVNDKDQHSAQLSLITLAEMRVKITELDVADDTVVTLRLSAQKRYSA